MRSLLQLISVLPFCHVKSELSLVDYRCRDDDSSNTEQQQQPFCIPDNYSRQERPLDPSENKVTISTGFIIDDVAEVDDDACAVTLVLIMRFSWKDERLVINESTFNERTILPRKRSDEDEKQRKGRLEMHYEGKQFLWTPDLFISNLRTLRNTGFLDHPGIKIDIAADKTIYYSRYAQVTFLCPMEYDHFPFDVHVCYFKVHSLEDPDTVLTFKYETNTSGIAWKTQTILAHHVTFSPLSSDESWTSFAALDNWRETFSTTGVKLTIRRKYLPFLIDVYLPSGLFVIVSWVSFLVPPAIVPGRMALLVTLFLMLVNISTSAMSHSPKSDEINALQIWLLTCILFVFLALLEYASILYLKNMKGVQKKLFKSGVIVITPADEGPDSKNLDECWINQQTEKLENQLKLVDYTCIILFPLIFTTFNVVYWTLQYVRLTQDSGEILLRGSGGETGPKSDGGTIGL